jgi:hypothetical protein
VLRASQPQQTRATGQSRSWDWTALEVLSDRPEVQETIRSEIERGRIRVIPAPNGRVRIVPVGGQFHTQGAFASATAQQAVESLGLGLRARLRLRRAGTEFAVRGQ